MTESSLQEAVSWRTSSTVDVFRERPKNSRTTLLDRDFEDIRGSVIPCRALGMLHELPGVDENVSKVRVWLPRVSENRPPSGPDNVLMRTLLIAGKSQSVSSTSIGGPHSPSTGNVTVAPTREVTRNDLLEHPGTVLFSVNQASGGLYTNEGLSFVMIRLLGPALVLADGDDVAVEVLVEVSGVDGEVDGEVLERLPDGLAVLLVPAVLLMLGGAVPPVQVPGVGQQNGSENPIHVLHRQSE